MVTVTFNTNGGSSIAPITVVKDSYVILSSYKPTKSEFVFGGWFTDEGLETPAGLSLTPNANTTLYAKWNSQSDLADYIGVWMHFNMFAGLKTLLLKNDGTYRLINDYGSIEYGLWNKNDINYRPLTLSEDKQTLTIDGEGTYTKQTETKTPAGEPDLAGLWVWGYTSLDLKANGEAVVKRENTSETFGYCVEKNVPRNTILYDFLYLLDKETNLIVAELLIRNGNIGQFSKPTTDSSLIGIWEIDQNGRKYTGNDRTHTITFNADGTYLSIQTFPDGQQTDPDIIWKASNGFLT